MTVETARRVSSNTDQQVNERLRREMLQRLYYYQHHPMEIEARLQELDREWDVERILEGCASGMVLGSAFAGLLRRRGSLLLTAAVGGFLLQHALQGWCPPLPILRRLGFRTAPEIETERYALMILRGDFEGMDSERVESVLPRIERTPGGLH